MVFRLKRPSATFIEDDAASVYIIHEHIWCAVADPDWRIRSPSSSSRPSRPIRGFPEHEALFARVRSGDASEEQARFRELHEARPRRVLAQSPEELFDVKPVDGEPPAKARIHASMTGRRVWREGHGDRVRRLHGQKLCARSDPSAVPPAPVSTPLAADICSACQPAMRHLFHEVGQVAHQRDTQSPGRAVQCGVTPRKRWRLTAIQA